MKGFIFGFVIALAISACSMAGKSYKKTERRMQDKMYVACKDSMTENPTGKLCNTFCSKRDSKGKCKKDKYKKVTVKNFCDPETFKWFRAASFIMISEDQVL